MDYTCAYNNFKNDYQSEMYNRKDLGRNGQTDTNNIELGNFKSDENWQNYDCLSPLLSKYKFRWWITRKFTMQLALTILIVLVLYISWGYNQVNRGSSNGPHNERIFNDHDVVSPPVLTSKVSRRISLTNPEAALAMELETLCHQLHYTSLPPPLGLMVTENGYYNTSLLNAMDKQIHKLSLVHTLPPVLSPSECRWIIDTTEKYTKMEWFDSNKDPRKDLNDDRRQALFKSFNTKDKELLSIPTISYYVANIIHRFIIPAVEERYGVAQGRLGINELYMVKVENMGTTAFHEFLTGNQFGFIIPLNEGYVGGRYLLTSNNDEYMEDNDGSLFPDKILEITQLQRAAIAREDSNESSKTWKYGVRNLIIDPKEMSDMVGSVYIFSAKTMIHKDMVTEGTRYAIVGNMGYASYYACNWYDVQIEERIFGSSIYNPEHQAQDGIQVDF